MYISVHNLWSYLWLTSSRAWSFCVFQCVGNITSFFFFFFGSKENEHKNFIPWKSGMKKKYFFLIWLGSAGLSRPGKCLFREVFVNSLS